MLHVARANRSESRAGQVWHPGKPRCTRPLLDCGEAEKSTGGLSCLSRVKRASMSAHLVRPFRLSCSLHFIILPAILSPPPNRYGRTAQDKTIYPAADTTTQSRHSVFISPATPDSWSSRDSRARFWGRASWPPRGKWITWHVLAKTVF